jgi:peptide/nickel transport system permease protein
MKLGENNRSMNLQLKSGIWLLGVIVGVFLLSILFTGTSLEVNIEKRLQKSTSFHILGTDNLGRDLLFCIAFGIGISLLIGLLVVLFSLCIGVPMGIISGFTGGIVDSVVMRIVDVILAFPGILSALAIMAFLESGIFNLILALTFSQWVGYTRIVRGEVLKLKQKEFIMAAKSYNASFFRIIFTHFLPLIFPLVVVQASISFSHVILAESSLNFLGIGLKPGLPTLGQLVDSGRNHIFDHPQLMLYPGIVLFLLIISFTFIGDGLREKLTK